MVFTKTIIPQLLLYYNYLRRFGRRLSQVRQSGEKLKHEIEMSLRCPFLFLISHSFFRWQLQKNHTTLNVKIIHNSHDPQNIGCVHLWDALPAQHDVQLPMGTDLTLSLCFEGTPLHISTCARSSWSSQAGSHPSVNHASCCLTSLVKQELVSSGLHGHWLAQL